MRQVWVRFKRHTFNGKGTIFIIFLNIVVNFAYFCTSATVTDYIFANILPDPTLSISSAIQQIVISCYAIVYPFAGFVADVCLGRHSTIRRSMVIMWCALVVLSVSVALTDGGYQNIVTTSVIPIASLLLLIIGLGGSRPISYHLELIRCMEGASSDQISSYFFGIIGELILGHY